MFWRAGARMGVLCPFFAWLLPRHTSQLSLSWVVFFCFFFTGHKQIIILGRESGTRKTVTRQEKQICTCTFIKKKFCRTAQLNTYLRRHNRASWLWCSHGTNNLTARSKQHFCFLFTVSQNRFIVSTLEKIFFGCHQILDIHSLGNFGGENREPGTRKFCLVVVVHSHTVNARMRREKKRI